MRPSRLDRRRVLVWVSALSAAGLATFAVTTSPLALGVAALLGMLNGMGRDRGAAQALDQALLADAVPDAGRTALFTRYTLIQDLAATAGSLARITSYNVCYTKLLRSEYIAQVHEWELQRYLGTY